MIRLPFLVLMVFRSCIWYWFWCAVYLRLRSYWIYTSFFRKQWWYCSNKSSVAPLKIRRLFSTSVHSLASSCGLNCVAAHHISIDFIILTAPTNPYMFYITCIYENRVLVIRIFVSWLGLSLFKNMGRRSSTLNGVFVFFHSCCRQVLE
jgi:hypothetical protein